MYKIVIIEDEPIIRKSLVNHINWGKLNCRVVGSAEDGEAGIELIESHLPEIVISDIQMDNVNGIEISKYVKENYPDINVVLITGFAVFDYARDALKHGVVDFILKPIDPSEITEAISRIVIEIEKNRTRKSELLRLKKQVVDVDTDNDICLYTGDNLLVKNILEFIFENYNKSYNLTQMAEEMQYNPKYLSALFKKEMGQTITEVLMKIRIEKSKEMLRNTNLKIYEIAYAVGVQDTHYFSQFFKKYTGFTPSEYRCQNA